MSAPITTENPASWIDLIPSSQPVSSVGTLATGGVGAGSAIASAIPGIVIPLALSALYSQFANRNAERKSTREASDAHARAADEAANAKKAPYDLIQSVRAKWNELGSKFADVGLGSLRGSELAYIEQDMRNLSTPSGPGVFNTTLTDQERQKLEQDLQLLNTVDVDALISSTLQNLPPSALQNMMSDPQLSQKLQPYLNQPTNGASLTNSFNSGGNPVTPAIANNLPPNMTDGPQLNFDMPINPAQATGNTPLGAFNPNATQTPAQTTGAPAPASNQLLSNLPSQQQFLQQLFQMFGLGNGGVSSLLQGAGTAAAGGGALGGLVGSGLGQVGNALEGLFGQGQTSSTGGSNVNTNTNTFAPTNTSSNTNAFAPSNTASPTNTFNPTSSNSNTFNPSINVAAATVPNQTNSNNPVTNSNNPNSYYFNNGFQTPANGMLGGSFGQDPNNPDPNAFNFGSGTPPPADQQNQQTQGAAQNNPLSQLLQMFGIQNPAQAGLGAGILGIGQLLNKDVNLPDFWQDRGVQDLYNFGNQAQHPMDPNVEAAMQRTLDIQNEQQLRNLRDVYKNARPGGDYLNDSAYQRDLANLQRKTSLNNADAMAQAQFKSNDQQIGVKSNLAEGSVGQGRAQALLDTQKNTNQNKLFGDLGSAFITGSMQKPTNNYTQQITIPKVGA